MKRYSGNSSSIGTASHVEKRYQHTTSTSGKRRSKYKCVYYDKATQQCKKLRVGCVGPSNILCRDYRTPQPNISTPQTQLPCVGTAVSSPDLGVGKIICVQDSIYTVQYEDGNKIRKYWLREIKHIVSKQS